MKENSFARALAKAALSIGAIELRPTNPFKWASGTFNPIYNDNRMLLGKYEHYSLYTNGIIEIINRNDFQPDFACGTSLSGIPPAAMLEAQLLSNELTLLILFEEKTLYRRMKCASKYDKTDAEAIISTAPWAIPSGIRKAIEEKKGFMYIRPEAKKHGKQKLIEGNPQPGQTVKLVVTEEVSDIQSIVSRINDNNLMCTEVCVSEEEGWAPVENLNGRKVIVIEDLISTGGSALKEVNAIRNAGGEVLAVISIFNYGLDSAKRAFEEANCPIYSVLSYDTMLNVADEEEMFTLKEIEILAEWREDQPNWGTKHGFLPEVKK